MGKCHKVTGRAICNGKKIVKGPTGLIPCREELSAAQKNKESRVGQDEWCSKTQSSARGESIKKKTLSTIFVSVGQKSRHSLAGLFLRGVPEYWSRCQPVSSEVADEGLCSLLAPYG
jgi:hypothetical protein